jgi:hypothetical protein
MNKLYKEINRVKFLIENHKNFGDERSGNGNSIDLLQNKYNIHKEDDFPKELLNVQDSATTSKYWEDTLKYVSLKKNKLSNNKKLYTTQGYLSKSFIDTIDNNVYNDSDIIVATANDNKLWILNGHHRIYYDRLNDINSIAYILSKNDVKEIDNVFYTSEDDEQ